MKVFLRLVTSACLLVQELSTILNFLDGDTAVAARSVEVVNFHFARSLSLRFTAFSCVPRSSACMISTASCKLLAEKVVAVLDTDPREGISRLLDNIGHGIWDGHGNELWEFAFNVHDLLHLLAGWHVVPQLPVEVYV